MVVSLHIHSINHTMGYDYDQISSYFKKHTTIKFLAITSDQTYNAININEAI